MLESTNDQEPWVSKRTVADHYGFTTRTVTKWVTHGCPSRLLSNTRRFRLSEVDAWLTDDTAAAA